MELSNNDGDGGCSAGLMPTEARRNYLLTRDKDGKTKTYLNCGCNIIGLTVSERVKSQGRPSPNSHDANFPFLPPTPLPLPLPLIVFPSLRSRTP